MEALKPSEVLSRAADLVEPVGAWTQRESGRDARGTGRESTDPDNVCWCAMGAVWKQTGGPASSVSDTCRHWISKAIGTRGVFDWNDAPDRTQAEVVAALRKAADLAREDGQ